MTDSTVSDLLLMTFLFTLIILIPDPIMLAQRPLGSGSAGGCWVGRSTAKERNGKR